MNSILKYIFIAIGLLAILILLPVILAPILHMSHVDSYFNYGGKESDWISFWGNYLGAVITGIVSFVILWYTIKTNKEENQAIISANQMENTRILQANVAENTRIIEANQAENTRIIETNKEENTRMMDANGDFEAIRRKQEYYLRFRTEVSIRLSKMDLAKFIGVSVDYDTPYREAKFQLESFHGQLTEDFNSFLILYDGDCNDFIDEYRKVVDVITDKIANFLRMFKEMNSTGDSQVRYDKQKEIREEVNKLKDLKPVINALWSKAKVEIDKLKV